MSESQTSIDALYPDFPLAEIPPAASSMDLGLVRALANRSTPLEGITLRDALASHAEFLAHGGAGGHFQSLDMGGLPLCIYDRTASAGTQLVLRHQRLGAGVDCSDADLSFADLSSSLCEGVVFRGAKLVGSIAIDGFFAGADFAGADLSNVDFSRSRLEGCSFVGAKLEGADFENANLTGADFTDTDLSGARFPGALLERVIR